MSDFFDTDNQFNGNNPFKKGSLFSATPIKAIDNLSEAKYFSDEQKEYLKDYQFSYILRDFSDDSMQTDDDCGNSITKIAVLKNNGYGDIEVAGVVTIKITSYDDWVDDSKLFMDDAIVNYYIYSDNLINFPSHSSKVTDTTFRDGRKTVFEMLGILDDANKWHKDNIIVPPIEEPDEVTRYLRSRFSNHILCDKCHSLIDSHYWLNISTPTDIETYKEPTELDRAFFNVQCPVCKEYKEVALSEHPELFDIMYRRRFKQEE